VTSIATTLVRFAMWVELVTPYLGKQVPKNIAYGIIQAQLAS